MNDREIITVRCSWCGRETESSIMDDGPVYCSEACEIDNEESQDHQDEGYGEDPGDCDDDVARCSSCGDPIPDTESEPVDEDGKPMCGNCFFDCFEVCTVCGGVTPKDDFDLRGCRHCVRKSLEAAHGQVWDTAQLQEDFTVQGFLAPCVVVTRKSDGAKGSMEFTHMPRFYFDFREA